MSFNEKIEARAIRIVQSAVRESANKMTLLVLQKLAAGGKIDAAWLQAITAELSRISDLYSSQAINESTDDFIEQAKISATDAIGQTNSGLQTLSASMINAALINAKIHIKDITDSSVKVVSEIITNAIVTGKTNEEIAKEVQRRVVVEQGQINNQRAEMIAQSEMMSVYRQTQLFIGEELGFEYYEYVGPRDHRNEEVCIQTMGLITTKEEWLKLAPEIFQYGLHYGCRHQLVPVTLAKAKAYKVTIDFPDGSVTITAYR